MKKSLSHLIASAEEILEIQENLSNQKKNIISELLSDSGEFVEWQHYPEDDIIDSKTGAQYYYHAHPNSRKDFTEHGHFHLFMRNNRIKDPNILPLTHIIAISMNHYGEPQALFTVNHWVTGGVWEKASTVIEFLNKFETKQKNKSAYLNQWINSIVRLYKDDIIRLIQERDIILSNYQNNTSKEDVLDIKELEILSLISVSITSKLLELKESNE